MASTLISKDIVFLVGILSYGQAHVMEQIQDDIYEKVKSKASHLALMLIMSGTQPVNTNMPSSLGRDSTPIFYLFRYGNDLQIQISQAQITKIKDWIAKNK